MMTALCAARNIMGAQHDLWAINTEPEYHEETRETPRGSSARESKRPAYTPASASLNPRSATPAVVRPVRADANEL